MNNMNNIKRLFCKTKHFTTKFFYIHLLISFLFFSSVNIIAQEVSQITIMGIPAVLSSPNISDQKNNFDNGMYTVQFSYTSQNSGQVPFVFHVVVTKDGETLADIKSSPKNFSPGTYFFRSIFNDLNFPYSFSDILDQVGSSIKNQILQGGVIPEGNYMIKIEATPQEQSQVVTVIPGIANMQVIYPQPPILVTPANESNVIQDIPTFSWTPVVVPGGTSIDYNFLLVEVIDSQTPLQAISSNRAYADVDLTDQITYSYTPDNLPLEKGKKYAWQITAKDANGVIPFKDNGKSEIYTFTYKNNNIVSRNKNNFKVIPLVPRFADLIDLQKLNFDDQGSFYSLNGYASLYLKIPGLTKEQSTVTVNVSNLMVQKGSSKHPVLLGGDVSGNTLPKLSSVKGFNLKGLDKFIDIKGFRWSLGQGFAVDADFFDSNDNTTHPSGNLKLTKLGLQGNLTFSPPLELSGNQPNSQVKFEIKTLNWNSSRINGTGMILLSNKIKIPDVKFVYSSNQFSVDLSGKVNAPFSLVVNSNKLIIKPDNVEGNVKYNIKSRQVSYNLNLTGLIKLKIMSNATCGFNVKLNYDSQKGFSLKYAMPISKITIPKIDLGAVKMAIKNFKLANLDFNSSKKMWDFNINFDANFILPMFSNVTLPKIKGISLTTKGFSFPAINLSGTDLNNLPELKIGGFGITLKKFSVNKFTFPWFKWNGNNSGPWDFKADFSMSLPNLPNNFLPCFKNKKIEIKNAEFTNGTLKAKINSELAGNCEIPLGGKNKITVSKIAGSVSFKYANNKAAVNSNITLAGIKLVLGKPFACNGKSLTVKSTSIKILPEGIVEGSINNLVPGCSFKIGPYTASVTKADIILSKKNKKQSAVLNASAELSLNSGNKVTGSAKIDLMTGKLISYEFDIDKRFKWKLPEKNPVIVFNIKKAKISQDGLFIDGRETLKVGNTSVGATFDKLLLDLSNYSVKSGKVIIDKDFAFEAGINQQTNSLSFKAVENGSKLNLNPGLLMQLHGTLTIDTLGLHSSGKANCKINFSGFKLDSLEAVYSKDFAIGFKPFGVKKGKVEFFWKDQRIALIDPNGFQADPSFFAKKLIPDRLPLPNEKFAYIQLKENKTLLVNFTRKNDGTVNISTKKGKPVDIVFPGLQGNSRVAPTIKVKLNVDINPTTAQITNGKVTVEVHENNPLSDLSKYGIPLKLKEIFYGEQKVNGIPRTALFLKGKLKIFKKKLGQNGDVSIYYDNGDVKGSIALNNLSTPIPIISNRVILKIDSVNGSVDVPVLSGGNVTFNLNLAGGFNLMNNNNEVTAKAGVNLEYTQQQLKIKHIYTSGNFTGKKFSIGKNFSFKVDKINNLNISYSKSSGFKFDAGLDFTISALFGQNKQITVPLKNIELNSDIGIVIPHQDINDGTTPRFQAPAFDLGIFHLKPLALRIKSDTLNWNMLSLNSALNLIPKFDFALSFPSLRQTAPDLANASITLSDVGFSKGVFTGTVQPSYTFSNNGVLLPLGGGTGIYVKKISGGLLANKDGSQGYNINLYGSFKLPDYFAKNSQPCSNNTVSVKLTSAGGLVGTINNFTPCGTFKFGSFSLSFPKSKLSFAFSNNKQSLELNGNVTAAYKGSNNQILTVNGNLDFDVLNEKILSGSLAIKGPFTWGYPKGQNPLFEFTVSSAELNKSGFVFTGNGSFKADNSTVSVNFNQLALSLKTGKINSGNIKILNSFAFDIGLSPVKWSVTNSSSNFNLSTGIRLEIPKNLTVDKNGLTIDGASSAKLKYAGKNYPGLSAKFNSFLLGFNPFAVSSGSVDLNLTEQNKQPVRLAYYDKNGFHADNIAGALPDTLGLPTKDIAYIVLKDENGNSLVTSSAVSGGFKISTGTNKLPLVFACLIKNGNSDAPSIDVSFSNVVINSAAQVTSGSITVTSTDGNSLITLPDQIPLKITELHYDNSSNNNYHLYAKAEYKLPAALNSVKIDVDKIGFDKNGFTGTVKATNLVTKSFAKDAFIFKVDSTEISFGSTNSFKISGEIKSKLFKNSKNNNYSVIQYTANFNKKWAFNVDFSNLPSNTIELGAVQFVLENIAPYFANGNFGLSINGTFKAPDLFGNDFAVELDSLHIGTDGISVAKVNTNTSGLLPQSISMFGGKDSLYISTLKVSVSNAALYITMDGSGKFLGKTFNFTGMKIGSDGSLKIGKGDVNLIKTPVNLLSTYLVLDTLKIGIVKNKLELSAFAEATLPHFKKKADVNISIDKDGKPTVTGPTFKNFNPITIPDVGNIKVTELGLDFSNWSNIKLFASVDVNLNKPDGTGKNTISFGKADNKVSDAGFTYSINDGLKWGNINAPANFEFGLKAFNVTDASFDVIKDKELGLKIGGDANLTVPGVTGKIGFKGMEITTTKVESFGNFTGGTLSMLSGEVTIKVPKVEYGSGDTTLTFTEQKGIKKDPGTQTVTVKNVKQYFIMGSAGISIGGDKNNKKTGFSGGIEKLIYYRTTKGMFLNIEHAELTLSGKASVDISMKYITKGSDYSFMVAGKAQFNKTQFAAMGKISNIQGTFKFGVFVKASVTIPIISGVITLTRVGGGFFINPDANDFKEVLQLTNYTIQDSTNWEKNIQSDPHFAVILYAGVGIIGGGDEAYALKGQTLIVVTDKFFDMDVKADYMIVKKAGLGSITAGMYIDVTFPDGGKPFNIAAGGNLNVEIKKGSVDFLKGNASFNFNATKSGGKMVWALTAGANLHILIVDATSNLAVSPDGLYFDCNVSSSINASIVTLKAGMTMKIWYLATTQNNSAEFGAFAKVDAHASVLGLGVGISLKGALLVKSKYYLIYFAGSAEVDYGVGSASVSVWASLNNNKLDAGIGHNKAMDKLITDASNEAKDMNNKMQKAIAAMNEAKNAPTISSINPKDLALAGYKLLSSDLQTRSQYGYAMYHNESNFTNSISQVPQIFNDIKNNIIEGNQPTDYWDEIDNDKANMNASLSAIPSKVVSVTNELKNLKATGIQLQNQNETLSGKIKNISSPVSRAVLDWNPSDPPGFTINSTAASENKTSLNSFKKTISQMNTQYLDAISAVTSNIAKLDRALAGKKQQNFNFIDVLPQIKIKVNNLLIETGITGLNNSGIKPSIDDMANAFVEASENMNSYYGNYISFMWEMKNFANSKLGYLSGGVKTQVSNALVSQLSSAIGYSFSPSNKTSTLNNTSIWRQFNRNPGLKSRFIEAIAQRRKYINNILPNNNARQQYQTDITEYTNEINKKHFDALEQNFYNSGMDLWYNMINDGLNSIVQKDTKYIDTLNTQYNNLKSFLEQKHQAFTKLEDQIYTIKFNMLTTLYGMLEQYETWRSAAAGDSSISSAIKSQKEDLQTEMEAPQITKISVSKSLKGFDNTVSVNWDVNHPTGNIAEVSYKILTGTGNSVYSYGLQSAGVLTGLNFHAFKENPNDLSHNYRFILRARGPAGNTVSRVATFTVPIAAANGGPGTGNSTNNNAITADNTPPIKPILLTGPPYDYSSKMELTSAYKFNQPKWTSVNTYWTHINNKIELGIVMSSDPQSDIVSFAFAVGKTKGDSSIINWHDIQGSRVYSNNSSGVVNAKQKITINDLIMKSGKLYFVSLKAKNGAGLYSSALKLDAIGFDPTPPGKPDSLKNGISAVENLSYIGGFGFGFLNGNGTSSRAEIYGIPKMDLPPTNKTMKEPKTKIQWRTASDAQSGIKGYEYAYDHNGNAVNAFKNPDNIHFTSKTNVEVDGDPFSYTNPVYVHIRAVNNAGLHGKTITYGPYTAPDISSPSTPGVEAMVIPGNVKLYVVSPSYDLESGIDYVQYAIGTTAGGTDITDFPSNGSNLQGQRLYIVPEWRSAVKTQTSWSQKKDALAYNISATNLPADKKLYFSYRTVNKQGKVSGKAIAGPVIIDNTPPESPGIKIIPIMNNGKAEITLTLSNIYDPESGVEKVEYEIKTKSVNGSWWITANNWTDLVNNGIQKNKQNYTKYLPVNGNISQTDIFKVGIRVTNGNGRQRVTWSNVAKIIVQVKINNVSRFNGFNH